MVDLSVRRVGGTHTLFDGTMTSTSAGEAQISLPWFTGVVFILNVSAAATANSDTMDVQVQTLVGDDQWVDAVAFTRILGDGGTVVFVSDLVTNAAISANQVIPPGALGAGEILAIIGDAWRVTADLVDGGGGDTSFTFTVKATIR